MIEGTNSAKIIFQEEYTIAAGNASAEGKVSMADVIADLKARRQNILSGGINCIPFPFKRFRTEFPGIEQEQYVLLTAGTKAGKTQLASYLLYEILDYAFNNPDKCSAHIIYFNLEESEQRIKQRYISHLLFRLDGWRIAPTDLRSTDADFPLPEEALALLEEDRYQQRLSFFDKCVQFESEETNPTGILRVCEEYAKSVGTYETYTRKSRGSDKEIKVFKSYTPNDKKHYKIVLIDHVGLCDLERGMTTKTAIDKVSEYAVKYLRNRLKYFVLAIQQQAMESEGLEAIKQKKLIPAVATLGDTKYTARDANYVMGLFDPAFFGLSSWLGYNIQDANGVGLKTYGRFLYILRGRDGEQGGICPLFFDGAVCNFEELPRPDEVDKVAKFYNKAKTLKTYRQQKKASMLSMTAFIKRIFNVK